MNETITNHFVNTHNIACLLMMFCGILQEKNEVALVLKNLALKDRNVNPKMSVLLSHRLPQSNYTTTLF